MVENLIFIIQGECSLYGELKMLNQEQFRVKVVQLKEGSWYGDYQILLNVKSTWQLEASKGIKKSKQVQHIPPGKVQVF